ncbi:uncharacterized protein LOC129908411 [Episyrphus balteatus]|uniref:uncharacterized protein LOC129908411 n=1 Tax=Episyrphus balteatus TaxID=286459 RepID=UPI002485E5BF|nr:uncharacterized protein LOC129908411 [Episyrphus balteatus]
MKFFVVLFAVIATAAAAAVSTEYLPPVQEAVIPSNEYLPPVAAPVAITAEEPTVLADDGYRYKTVKRFRLRHRRDVNELPSNEYLPPVEEAQFAVAEPQPEIQTVLADDGYRYKTVKRFRLRHRRDVNELPSNEYLPPVEEAQFAVAEPQPEIQTVLADDGYRYKTVKRFRLRHRRDVNELPSNEYLPPVEEAQFAVAEPQPEIQTVLADDGYRYKTVKRFRLRHRRDVNELPSNEYLPPVEEAQFAIPEPQPEIQTVLADDGYRYKTVKRFRLRHRRDVNELPSNEYLPPVEEAQFAITEPQPEIQTVLADDGYRYKTVKRFRLRHRRDVNELPSNEYLPPVEEAQFAIPEPQPEIQTVLADDGYRYKTVKRFRLRRH